MPVEWRLNKNSQSMGFWELPVGKLVEILGGCMPKEGMAVLQPFSHVLSYASLPSGYYWNEYLQNKLVTS